MPQIVEADSTQAGRLQTTMEMPFDDVVGVERAASCRGEYQPAIITVHAGLQFLCRLLLLMPAQQ